MNSQQMEMHQEQYLELGMQGETQELKTQQEELQREQLELCRAQHQTVSPLKLAHTPNTNVNQQMKG